VLLDMHLPDMSGMDVLRRLKAAPATADIPVVIVSADALPATIEGALAAGARRYLSKPVSVSELLALVDQLLVTLHTKQRMNLNRLRPALFIYRNISLCAPNRGESGALFALQVRG
jgi:DNA-binding response OmpR family regulator